MKAQSFVFPTRFVAHTLEEFRECLRGVTIFSIYYHLFEARLRLQSDLCDFALWFQDSLDERDLAEAFTALDPYTQTLDNLRHTLVQLVDERITELRDA